MAWRLVVSDFTRLGDADSLGGLARLAADALDLLHNIESLKDLTEHDVLAYESSPKVNNTFKTSQQKRRKRTIEPRGRDSGDEKLGALGVRTSVGHAEVSRALVLDLEVLV